MTVLRLCKAAEETGAGEPTMWRAIEPGGMSTELTEDGGAPNVSLRQLPAPGTIAASDLAARLADADAAISTIQGLLGEVRTSHDELRRTLDDLKRDRDEWRGRAERLTERPWRQATMQAEITSSTARRPCVASSLGVSGELLRQAARRCAAHVCPVAST